MGNERNAVELIGEALEGIAKNLWEVHGLLTDFQGRLVRLEAIASRLDAASRDRAGQQAERYVPDFVPHNRDDATDGHG